MIVNDRWFGYAADMFDPTAIRKDFPILHRHMRGKSLIYLDNAATSQKPESVLQSMDDFQRNHNANVHRGIYALSEEATALYEGARKKVRTFINAKGVEEIIFTRNATEAINLVALGWARQNLKAGDEVLTTGMEHHSNIVPWQMLAKERKISLKFVPVKPDFGTLDMGIFESLTDTFDGDIKSAKLVEDFINQKTKLESFAGWSS